MWPVDAMVPSPGGTVGASSRGLAEATPLAHTSHQGSSPAGLSRRRRRGFPRDLRRRWKCNNIVTPQRSGTGSSLPGRVRAPESLVGGSGGDGARLRKGSWLLRPPIGTATPQPTVVIRRRESEKETRQARAALYSVS